MTKKIFIGIAAVILVTLLLTGKFSVSLFENPIKGNTSTLGVQEITTHSAIEQIPGPNYCTYIRKQYYENPWFEVKNINTGKKTSYKFNSDNLGTRIILSAQTFSDEEGVSDMLIKVSDTGIDCSTKTWYGSIVITSDGEVYPIALKPEVTRDDVYFISNKSKEKVYIILKRSNITQQWSGEFNGDRKGDYFFSEPDPNNEDHSINYMWEVKENRFAPWFNNGQPLKMDRSVEEINDNWTTQRALINTHIQQ